MQQKKEPVSSKSTRKTATAKGYRELKEKDREANKNSKSK